MIDASRLHRVSPASVVWRVGRRPAPWDWTDWRFASQDTGTFPGRWDSPVPHSYRTTYAASTPEGALLEVLARFRPDPAVAAAMAEITVDPVDSDLHPTVRAGVVPDDWFTVRMLATAHLDGTYCDVAHSETVAALWADFADRAINSDGLPDFDGSALQNAHARPLTQAISARLYAITLDDDAPALDGIRFLSRFGADQELWTVFEQPSDGDRSRLLSDTTAAPLTPADPHVRAAMDTLGLAEDA